MKLVTLNSLDGKSRIVIAAQDEDISVLEAFFREADELFLKREYIEQDYAKVILAEDKSPIEEDHV